MNETRDTYEIDILRLLRAMLKNWWVMVIPALIFAVLVYSYITMYVPTQYRATVAMFVKMETGVNTSTGLDTARKMLDSHTKLATRKETADMIYEYLEKEGPTNGSYSPEAIHGMIQASYNSENFFIDISVTCGDAEDASRIVNMVAQVLPIMAGPDGYDFPTEITIHPDAMAEGAAPALSKNLTRNTMIGFLLGILLGAAVIVLREIFDDRIQSEDWLKQTFKDEIPLLAVIPSADRTGRKYGYNSYDRYSTYYRSSKGTGKTEG